MPRSPPDSITGTGHFKEEFRQTVMRYRIRCFLNVLGNYGGGRQRKERDSANFPWALGTQSKRPRKVAAVRSPLPSQERESAGRGRRAPRRLLGAEVPHPAFTAMLPNRTRGRDYNSQEVMRLRAAYSPVSKELVQNCTSKPRLPLYTKQLFNMT